MSPQFAEREFDAPAYTFGGKRKGKDEWIRGEGTPGPGAYTPRIPAYKPSSPAYSLGSKGGRLGGSSDSPGPGQYNVISRAESPKYTFGMKTGGQMVRLGSDSCPGPGAYEPGPMDRTIAPASPRYSFGGRRTYSPTRDGVPGPGAYRVKSSFSSTQPSSPSWSMGHKEGAKLYTPGGDSPGPAAYGRLSSPIEGPAYSLAGRHTMRTDTNISPGPGAYSPVTASRGVPAKGANGFTFGVKPQPKTYDETPGPGQYGMRFEERRGYTFGLRPKEKGAGTDSPGPGAYHMPTALSRIGGVMGVKDNGGGSARLRDTSPGPGAYDYRPKTAGPMYSLTARPRGQERDTGPGPGAYSQDKRAVERSMPAYSMGSRSPLSSAGAPTPGPGAYNVTRSSIFKMSSPSYSLSPKLGGSTYLSTSDTPGPGQYRPRHTYKGHRVGALHI